MVFLAIKRRAGIASGGTGARRVGKDRHGGLSRILAGREKHQAQSLAPLIFGLPDVADQTPSIA
jgi:hypothetical protein